MIHPKRIDGNPLRVVTLPDGRVFVNVENEFETHRDPLGKGHQKYYNKWVSRGGPEHSRHFCRFQDYGLADGLVRCRKCGRVVPAGDLKSDVGHIGV